MSTDFERLMLRQIVSDARKLGAKIRDGWAIKTGNLWEFHYGEFYWWGRAENAYDARCKGWSAWIENHEH